MDELYDLAADPYELKNLIADPSHRADRDRLSQQLDLSLRSRSVEAERRQSVELPRPHSQRQ